ncbi:hypothetical protein CTAYLR_008431 [Chrysophaeum taylorii]|uniref:Oxidoreductase n=1 Tax=Chrysophaeum taylorii TaxID=2483200 RepID=A0AAD7ULW7_9STRA|nr:hypothetical protein CTAYLR_008431 [Chrysophaeum taylorii]
MGGGSSKYTEPQKIESKWFPTFEAELPAATGKVIAVTGCTSGTGLVCAKTCAAKGAAHVLLLNRPSARATAAEEQVSGVAAEGTKVTTVECDLMSFESVKGAAARVRSLVGEVDVLCCNAGVMALEDKATVDGYDVQMQTNHLSHFLLAKELFPLLQKASKARGEARIVSHTSGARKFPTTPLEEKYVGKNGGNLGGNGASMFFGGARWVRYHETKLANVVFTLALHDRLAGTGIKAIAAAPGLAATNLQVTTHNDGGMAATWIMRFAQSAEDGTMPLLHCCLSPEPQSGELYEPSDCGAIKGPPKKVDPIEPICTDPKARDLLWTASEQACGPFPIQA